MTTLNTGDIVLDQYAIQQRVGRGGGGTVFQITDLRATRALALKVSRSTAPSSVARIRAEADVLSQLDHPGTCRCYDSGMLDDGHAFVVTDWVEGSTVGMMLRDQPLAISAALDVALAVGAVLEALHDQGVIHCDLKPSNVIVPAIDGDALYRTSKVVDFGIAKRLSRRSGDGELRSGVGSFAGTADYMAPEQLAGRRQGLATDIYGLGALTFAMVYGRPPYIDGELAKVIPPEPHLPRPFIGSFVVRRLTTPASIPEETTTPADLRAMLGEMLSLRLEDRPALPDVLRRLRDLRDCGAARCDDRGEVVDDARGRLHGRGEHASRNPGAMVG